MKKGWTRNFLHWNNAIYYTSPNKPFFGNNPGFTRDWDSLNIEFSHDVVRHNEFPQELIAQGYQRICHGSDADPGYLDGAAGKMKLEKGSPLNSEGRSLEIDLPDGSRWHRPAGGGIGAYRNDSLFQGPSFVEFIEGSRGHSL